MKMFFVLMAFAPIVAFAHGNKIEMVEQSTSEALKKFTAEESEAVVSAFNGVKSWVSGDKIKVKVYYNQNADTIDYACEMMHHDGEEMVMCTK